MDIHLPKIPDNARSALSKYGKPTFLALLRRKAVFAAQWDARLTSVRTKD
jgi:hypothetical protein